jgi:hypothetical protein
MNAPRGLPHHRLRRPVQIVTESRFGPLDVLHRPPPVRAHVALVLLNVRGRYEVVPPYARPTPGELVWKGIRTVYEVDLGQHQGHIDADLPSAGDTLPFRAGLDLQWRVQEPAEVVRRNLFDTRAVLDALRPEALDRMRRVSRRFAFADSERAEDQITDSLTIEPLGLELGLSVRAYVRLSLEPSTLDHASQVLDLTRKVELEKLTQTVRQLEQDNDHELTRERVAMYREFISRGDVEQFAAELARKPDDVHAVMNTVRADRDTGRQLAVEFFGRLVKSGLLERHQLSDIAHETLDWLNESVERVIAAKALSTAPPAGRQERVHIPDLPPPPPLNTDGPGPGDVHSAPPNGTPR